MDIIWFTTYLVAFSMLEHKQEVVQIALLRPVHVFQTLVNVLYVTCQTDLHPIFN